MWTHGSDPVIPAVEPLERRLLLATFTINGDMLSGNSIFTGSPGRTSKLAPAPVSEAGLTGDSRPGVRRTST